MGRRIASADEGEFPVPRQVEDKPRRISEGNHGCFQRSKSSASCADDGFAVRGNGDSEQHLRVFHSSRSRPDVGASTNLRNGTKLEPRPTGSVDSKHPRDPRSDRRSEVESPRQYDNPEGLSQWGEVEHSGIEQPSRVSVPPHPYPPARRDRQDASEQWSRGFPDSTIESEDREFLQPKNLSLFESHGSGRISYRGRVPRVGSASLLLGMSTLQGVADA